MPVDQEINSILNATGITLGENGMPSEQQVSAVLNTYGIHMDQNMFSWQNLLGGTIFGIIGIYAFKYGKNEKNYKPLMIGITLIAFPWFVTNTFWLYVVGIVLTSLLYFWKD